MRSLAFSGSFVALLHRPDYTSYVGLFGDALCDFIHVLRLLPQLGFLT